MIRARIRVDGRLAGGLQALWGTPSAAYRGCGERDGGIGHGKRRLRTGLARVGGDVQLTGWRVSGGRAKSGWEWNGSQPGQGASDLLLPRPAPGKMQGQPACGAGEPSRPTRAKTRQTESCRPAGQVMRHHLYRSQTALAAKRPEGRWFSPRAAGTSARRRFRRRRPAAGDSPGRRCSPRIKYGAGCGGGRPPWPVHSRVMPVSGPCRGD